MMAPNELQTNTNSMNTSMSSTVPQPALMNLEQANKVMMHTAQIPPSMTTKMMMNMSMIGKNKMPMNVLPFQSIPLLSSTLS